MHATVVGEGNSNVVLSLKKYYSSEVIRVCKRFSKVSLNNEYLLKNKTFQERFIKEFVGISKCIDEILYKKVDKDTDNELFHIIEKVLMDKHVTIDEGYVIIMVFKNHLNFEISRKINVDYYTTIYNDFMVEFKPKWANMSLYDYKKYINYPNAATSDKEVSFCRNCKHINPAKPHLYCYNGCKSSKSIVKYGIFHDYLKNTDNLIYQIYKLQRDIQQTINNNIDTDLFYINGLIALRDLSIFYNMKTNTEKIIDLDYKDIVSIKDFRKKMQKEWTLLE